MTNNSAGTVSVINTATNTILATINVGSFPNGVALNAAGTRAYVTSGGGDSVSVINTATLAWGQASSASAMTLPRSSANS